jgi:hypothetical protein
MIGRSQFLGERIMAFQDGLTTGEIATVFADEIAALGGSISDKFDDGARLFIRAVLRQEREVQPRDRVQGGVALRAIQEEVSIHPYVFRQVCQNGAIIAQSVETRLIDRTDFTYDPDAELALAIRDSIRECCEPEVFENVATAMRSAVNSPVDLALNLMPMLSRWPSGFGTEIFGRIVDEFFKTQRSSRFDLMNAVTAVARDTTDPETRWQLETIGGAVPFDAPTPVRKRSGILTA